MTFFATPVKPDSTRHLVPAVNNNAATAFNAKSSRIHRAKKHYKDSEFAFGVLLIPLNSNEIGTREEKPLPVDC
ncbi:hypothetical protein KIN20_019807 [Parelaphostrongylus tenuis]|uniref:Uncharacterized protein n=1 Tax=Parelaphostrongylus tenuis TaxID=148309 RepID=A0AAD5MLN4_PARTN|nr:hypothetical protein KIN20_019807 [Parelaphostrongylus tenuis]